MNVLIAGSRSANGLAQDLYTQLVKAVAASVRFHAQDLILVGDAPGVDAMVVAACEKHRQQYLCVGVFPKPRINALRYQQLNESPEQAAKPLYARFLARDAYLFSQADHVLCFWDGYSLGTKAMIDRARASSKTLLVHRFGENVR